MDKLELKRLLSLIEQKIKEAEDQDKRGTSVWIDNIPRECSDQIRWILKKRRYKTDYENGYLMVSW